MREDFEHYINLALSQIPSEFKEKLDNVAIFVEDFPTLSQVEKFRLREEGRMLLGLYEGIPKTKRGRYGIGGAVPDKITLFRVPILNVVRTKKDLIDQIKKTLYHEIGHHLGLSEEEIEKASRSPLADSSGN